MRKIDEAWQKALDAGKARFVDHVRPCSKHGVSERYTCNGECILCCRDRCNAAYARKKKKVAERVKKVPPEQEIYLERKQPVLVGARFVAGRCDSLEDQERWNV